MNKGISNWKKKKKRNEYIHSLNSFSCKDVNVDEKFMSLLFLQNDDNVLSPSCDRIASIGWALLLSNKNTEWFWGTGEQAQSGGLCGNL